MATETLEKEKGQKGLAAATALQPKKAQAGQAGSVQGRARAGKGSSAGKARTAGKGAKAEKALCHNKELGRRGEDAAVAFLRDKGYEVLERNWTCSAGEADIVARIDDELHFVEVKTRTSTKAGFPAEAVGPKKRRRYERIAERFLQGYEGEEGPVSFDIVSILVVSEHRAFLRFHKNAFLAGE